MNNDTKPDLESTFRPNPIFVTVDVQRALGYLARATHKSKDEIASAVLAAWLARDYPKLVEYLKSRNIEDSKFRLEFEKTVNPLPF